MNSLSISLISFVLIAVHGDQNNVTNSDHYNTVETGRHTEKSWGQIIPFWQQTPSPKGIVSPPNERSSGAPERFDSEGVFKNFIGYETIQNTLIKALRPKPIVDTAEESEKQATNYGSNIQIGDFIVKGAETLSRAINTVVQVPKNSFIKLSKGTTNALNRLGGYIVGL